MPTWCRLLFGLGLSAASLGIPASAAPPDRDGSVVTLTRPGRVTGRSGSDHSGRTRQGEAGVMTNRAPGERLAYGLPFDPTGAVAASSVLPLGTTLRVTNLDNGLVTMVQVQDLGARGSERLLDLSPGIARTIGLNTGVVRVKVAPLAVPQPDGTVRLGEGTGLAGQVAAAAVSERPRD